MPSVEPKVLFEDSAKGYDFRIIEIPGELSNEPYFYVYQYRSSTPGFDHRWERLLILPISSRTFDSYTPGSTILTWLMTRYIANSNTISKETTTV